MFFLQISSKSLLTFSTVQSLSVDNYNMDDKKVVR